MQSQKIQEILAKWNITTEVQYVKTLTSAVTTAWGVNWDEMYIARDLMQNFFDANRSQLDQVEVSQVGYQNRQDVAISAPSPFNLERLFYLGSEKGDDDIGQYGEGFKVAATCLLRDHNISPIVISGHDLICLRVAENAVMDTQLYPVEYDFYRTAQAVSGTTLILTGCSGKLAKALALGLSHFFYETNPVIGEKLWQSRDAHFSMYASKDSHGHIFYRKLKRGEIENLPIVLVIDKQFARIEKKISKDRDRNAFGDEMMKLFYNHFARYGLKYSREGQKVLVKAASNCWEKGHPLLSEIADAQSYHGEWSRAEGSSIFGDKYYARSNLARHYSPGRLVSITDQIEVDQIEKKWHEQGKIALPGYFSHFGIPSALEELYDARQKALENDMRKNRRVPSDAEKASIEILRRTFREVAPDVMDMVERRGLSYTVAQTETILGAMKSERGFRSQEVFLSEQVFVSDFADALSVFCHEHSHIFGYDGSRSFSDALTGLLAEVVRYRHLLSTYEVLWEEAREKVVRERNAVANHSDQDEIMAWLDTLSQEELRRVMGSLPIVLLNKLRGKPIPPSPVPLPEPRPVRPLIQRPAVRIRPMPVPAFIRPMITPVPSAGDMVADMEE